MKKTQKEWQIVFLITAVIYVIGATVLIIFASGNKAKSWAIDMEESNEIELLNE